MPLRRVVAMNSGGRCIRLEIWADSLEVGRMRRPYVGLWR